MNHGLTSNSDVVFAVFEYLPRVIFTELPAEVLVIPDQDSTPLQSNVKDNGERQDDSKITTSATPSSRGMKTSTSITHMTNDSGKKITPNVYASKKLTRKRGRPKGRRKLSVAQKMRRRKNKGKKQQKLR